MSGTTFLALRRVSRLANSSRGIVQRVTLSGIQARSLTLQHPSPSSRAWHLSTPNTILQQRRCNATTTSSTRAPKPFTERDDLTEQQASDLAARKALEPAYDLTFTCRKCLTRSTHRVTKQAYHKGTTLITCQGCKNRHLISDHLKIFSDKSITIEDILREKGEFLRKGRLGDDGDIEFYEDESVPSTEEVKD